MFFVHYLQFYNFCYQLSDSRPIYVLITLQYLILGRLLLHTNYASLHNKCKYTSIEYNVDIFVVIQ